MDILKVPSSEMIFAKEFSEISEKQSEAKLMSMRDEASSLVRQIGLPATGKAAVLRASRKLTTWTYNRVKDIYYADRRIKISGEEIERLRALSRKIEKPRHEPTIAELRERIEIIIQQFHRMDPTFNHPCIEALRNATHPTSAAENIPSGEDGKEGD